MSQVEPAELDEARAIYAARVELYGDVDPITVEALIRLTSILRESGIYSEAEALLSASLALQSRAPERNEYWITLTQFSLALILNKLGEDEAARRLWVDVLEASDTSLGPDSDQSTRAATNLAITLRKLRNYGDEFPLRVRVFEATVRAEGPAHVDTYRSMIDLAQTHRELGNHDKALALFVDALSGLERCDVEQRTLIYQRWAIASELMALKRRREASAVFDQVVQGSLEHLDADDPLRKSALRQRRAYRVVGKLSKRPKGARGGVEDETEVEDETD